MKVPTSPLYIIKNIPNHLSGWCGGVSPLLGNHIHSPKDSLNFLGPRKLMIFEGINETAQQCILLICRWNNYRNLHCYISYLLMKPFIGGLKEAIRWMTWLILAKKSVASYDMPGVGACSLWSRGARMWLHFKSVRMARRRELKRLSTCRKRNQLRCC